MNTSYIAHYLSQESFWIEFSFLLFIILGYKPIKRAIINMLDSKRDEISLIVDDVINKRKAKSMDVENAERVYAEQIEKNKGIEEQTKKEVQTIFQSIEDKAKALDVNAQKIVKNYKREEERKAWQSVYKNVVTTAAEKVRDKLKNADDALHTDLLEKAIAQAKKADWSIKQ